MLGKGASRQKLYVKITHFLHENENGDEDGGLKYIVHNITLFVLRAPVFVGEARNTDGRMPAISIVSVVLPATLLRPTRIILPPRATLALWRGNVGSTEPVVNRDAVGRRAVAVVVLPPR